jgi:MFS transporter, AAHS family, benzoate transport protein
MFPLRVHRMNNWTVVALCAMVVIVEGYDLIVYGALLPELLREPGWDLTRVGAGAVGSYVYVGMLLGAVAGGRLCDSFGRRRFVNTSVAWFAVWTFACALAAQSWQLGLFRFLAGLGMGAVIPAVLALAKEYSRPGQTALAATILMGGVPLGGSAAALLGQSVLPAQGWRPMFVIGGAVSVLILVVSFALLPESEEFRNIREGTTAEPAARASELFRSPRLVLTALFALATFTNMLTWYGMNTWLTALMRDLHYPLTSALMFSMTMNLGAVVGSFLMVLGASYWGTRQAAGVCALMAAGGIVWLALRPGSTAVLMTLIALIGVGAHAGLTLIVSSVADSYPARMRGSAIGWSNGLGRTGAILAPSLGGWVLAAGLGPRAVFFTFAVTALCSAVVIAGLILVGRRSSEAPPRTASLDAGKEVVS